MGGQSLRRNLLSLLLEVFPGSISGEHIAAHSRVSRVAVWKEVQKLRAEGFPVDASRSGYRLLALPDSFDPDFLEPYLLQEIEGVQVVFKEEMDSTNTYLKALAEQGAPEGTLCITENQKKGRGRRGRSWFSLPGKSLAFSLLLRPHLPLSVCPPLALLAGLALAEALEELGFSPRLKWPNDVLLGEKKVSGILLETSTDLDEASWVVLGVGVNVNLGKEDLASLPFQATSLFLERGAPLPRIEVLRKFLSHFFAAYRQWKGDGNFSPWTEEYNRRFALLGRPVTVGGGKEPVTGIALGVDEHGALRIREGGRERTITWGEIE